MTEPKPQPASAGDVCRRCCLPEDLLPIQQAAVIRSFPPAYANVVMGAGLDEPRRLPLPEGSSALEHATYVGAMFAAVHIALRQLLRREQPEPLASVIEQQGDPGQPRLQLTLSRLGDQAELVAQTIMTCAPGCDWRQPLSHDQPSPHGLAHLAIDEAAEHLRDAGSVLRLDAPALAVAGSGLFVKAGPIQANTPDLVGGCSGRSEIGGRVVRRVRERLW